MGKQTVKKDSYWRIAGEFRNRWWMTPICWVVKHKKRVINPFGVKAKQCQRCGKYYWRKLIPEKSTLYSGEVGQLYNVRFVTTKRNKKI